MREFLENLLLKTSLDETIILLLNWFCRHLGCSVCWMDQIDGELMNSFQEQHADVGNRLIHLKCDLSTLPPKYC